MGRRYGRNVPLEFAINGMADQNYLLRSQSLLTDEKLNEEFEMSFQSDFIAENMNVRAKGHRSEYPLISTHLYVKYPL